MSVVISRTKVIALGCVIQRSLIRGLALPLAVQIQSEGIRLCRVDVFLLASRLCVSLGICRQIRKAKIRETGLKGIPHSINWASEQFKETPDTPAQDQY